ncbi:MAG: hypothetical protein ACRD82_09965 [Blastocatellia bacterium]
MPRNWLSCPPNSIPFVSVHIGVDRYLALIDPGSFVSVISNLNPIKKGLDLLLGVNAFKNCRLHIDFKEGRIYVFPEG